MDIVQKQQIKYEIIFITENRNWQLNNTDHNWGRNSSQSHYDVPLGLILFYRSNYITISHHCINYVHAKKTRITVEPNCQEKCWNYFILTFTSHFCIYPDLTVYESITSSTVLEATGKVLYFIFRNIRKE